MKSALIAALGGASTALAAVRGFNYASQGQSESGFAGQFKTAQSLQGANDFSSARLYTMIQEGSTNSPIEAIQAAIDTNTTLLLGLWASQDQSGFSNELAALSSAISTYGSQFASLVVGISVGSEDLYRISPIGISNHEGVGQTPDVLVNYIGQVRDTIKGTSLASKPVGHVDTWNVYVNGSNSEVIAACDWLGLDEYPYYQTTDQNSIGNAKTLFFQAYDKVAAVAGGKPIYITESGWPTTGPQSNLAVASTSNAETYWQAVACELECRNIDFWWYTLADAGASPSFGVSNNGQPLYKLSCGPCGSNSTSSTSGSNSTSTASSTMSAASGSSTASASGSNGSPMPSGGSGGNGGSSSVASGGASSTSSSGPAKYTSGASQVEASAVALLIGAAVAFFAL